VWASNSNSGGVSLPSAVVIEGTTFLVAPSGNTSPQALTFSGLNFTGNSLTVQFDQANSFNWVMIGEVAFNGTTSTAPEPASYLLFVGALPLFVAIKRRKRI
jgi:hypothetical protein